MTAGTIKTQGTELFLIDNLTTTTDRVVKMTCPTGITGLGGPRGQIPSTCLDALQDETFVAGLATPGAVTVPFNFVPSAMSQQLLFDLKEAGSVIPWMIGFSDGAAAPTLSSGDFVAPSGRTSAEFQAFVADVNIDIATNELVRGTLLLQRSGSVEWNWNGPTP